MDIELFARPSFARAHRVVGRVGFALLCSALLLAVGCDKLPGRTPKRPPHKTDNNQMSDKDGSMPMPGDGDGDGDGDAHGDGDAPKKDAGHPGDGDGDKNPTDAGDKDTGTPGDGDSAQDSGTKPKAVRVEAENFQSGEGVGYHDTTPANEGGKGLTTEGVDIEDSGDSETPGSLSVSHMQAGEWIKYSFALDIAADYTLGVRVAHATGGGGYTVYVDDTMVTTFTTPSTGSWTSWTTVMKHIGNLEAGSHVLKITVDSAGPNMTDAGNINYFDFIPGG
jgi:hypothetical protein